MCVCSVRSVQWAAQDIEFLQPVISISRGIDVPLAHPWQHLCHRHRAVCPFPFFLLFFNSALVHSRDFILVDIVDTLHLNVSPHGHTCSRLSHSVPRVRPNQTEPMSRMSMSGRQSFGPMSGRPSMPARQSTDRRKSSIGSMSRSVHITYASARCMQTNSLSFGFSSAVTSTPLDV